MIKTQIEKLEWKFGDPATWPGLYEKNEVPFSCMCCRKKTATHRVTIKDLDTTKLRPVLCDQCAGLNADTIYLSMMGGK